MNSKKRSLVVNDVVDGGEVGSANNKRVTTHQVTSEKALYDIWENNKQLMVIFMGAKQPSTLPQHYLKRLEHDFNPDDLLIPQLWTLIIGDYLGSYGMCSHIYVYVYLLCVWFFTTIRRTHSCSRGTE